MFPYLCIFGEGWPLSAPLVGFLVGHPCASHFVEQSDVLMNPREVVQERKDRDWQGWGAPGFQAAP